MKTRVTELFGIEHPIIQGGMHYVGYADVAGVYPRIMKEGEVDAGAWSCGMVAGLINDIPSCQELIDRIMRDADQLIAQRLEGLRAGTAAI
jgi:nitronate monooxygenase